MAAARTKEQEQPLLPIRSGSSKKGKKSTPPNDEPSAIDVITSLVVLVLVILGGVYFKRHCWKRIFGPFDPVEYTVAIAAVSGLDPGTDLHPRPATFLDPAFNLTLCVASPSTALRRECIKPGTIVEVSYLRSRVPLAAGTAPAFCVEVGEERVEGSVIVWGYGVRLPGFVLDSLAADMRRGTAEFGVKLTDPVPYCAAERTTPFRCHTGGSIRSSRYIRVLSCWAKIGGGPAPCSVSFETASFPVLRAGTGRDSSASLLPQPTL
ncbi:unnamed protein product [Urochloa decumbens]|uniref:Uncharacterized protein n=1 Tax=Urochloa decumbens TaxID=240449 RepID=A0ABC9DBQ9_9POAL